MSDDVAAPPVLAFAHANGIPGHSYDHFLQPLAGNYRLHVVEKLGHDPAYPVDRNWHSLSLELEAELQTLPRPIVGVGHSLGAVLMFLVARRRPQWFRSLVMLDPPLLNGWHGTMMRLAQLTGQVDRVTPAGKSQGRLDYWADWSSVQSYFHSRGFFRAFDPHCLEDYLKAGLEPWQDGWRLAFRPDVEVAIFRNTPTAVTAGSRLAVPGALVTGRQSPKPFHDCARRHVRRHHMLHRLAEGSHMYPLEKPEQTAQLLQDTLAVLETQS
ncbi:MAG: alpha/beta hydrolase [Alcanivorax sp.]|nr:alpha/beta hydrolase [Alcanivorax sp.]